MIYNPKSINLKELEDARNLWIKSKIKFQWDFKKSLNELVSKLEIKISEKIIKNYWVEYTSYWDQIIKVKVNDKNQMIEKLITCTLFYNKNDKTYGYITPLFTSAEKSQKTKKYELTRFSLSDIDLIVDKVIGKIVEIVEEF